MNFDNFEVNCECLCNPSLSLKCEIEASYYIVISNSQVNQLQAKIRRQLDRKGLNNVSEADGILGHEHKHIDSRNFVIEESITFYERVNYNINKISECNKMKGHIADVIKSGIRAVINAIQPDHKGCVGATPHSPGNGEPYAPQ